MIIAMSFTSFLNTSTLVRCNWNVYRERNNSTVNRSSCYWYKHVRCTRNTVFTHVPAGCNCMQVKPLHPTLTFVCFQLNCGSPAYLLEIFLLQL